MIRLTERYYDTYCHGYQNKPLFLNESYIASIKQSDDRYENYCIVTISTGEVYTVLESAETVASACAPKEKRV